MVQGNTLHDSNKLWVIRSGDVSIVSIMYARCIWQLFLSYILLNSFLTQASSLLYNNAAFVNLNQMAVWKFVPFTFSSS